MSFDFPNTPSIGDLFQDSTTGAVYQWNGYAWIGGVTGIGLQTIKETRYLTAGSFTFTRDPKSSGFGDIHLLGAMGGSPAVTWASGQTVLRSSGSAGAIGIKWKYALPATAPVVVGASSGTAQAGASSFDTVLVAPGGLLGIGGTVIATGTTTANGPGLSAPATGCDESYTGMGGPAAVLISGTFTGPGQAVAFLRDVFRRSNNSNANGTASFTAAAAEQGAVIVREYLNP